MAARRERPSYPGGAFAAPGEKFDDERQRYGAMGWMNDSRNATKAMPQLPWEPLREASEDALAENSHRMQIAAGLLAGVVPNDGGARNNANPGKKPVMAMEDHSGLRISALDDVIPAAATMMAPASSSNKSVPVAFLQRCRRPVRRTGRGPWEGALPMP